MKEFISTKSHVTIKSGKKQDRINLPIREWSSFEYLELSGIVKFPLWIAKALSPKGNEKKHSRYNRHPIA